jgi:hypothetical protein
MSDERYTLTVQVILHKPEVYALEHLLHLINGIFQDPQAIEFGVEGVVVKAERHDA